nr:Imm7 family immunity protein [Longimicrobium terrae]
MWAVVTADGGLEADGALLDALRSRIAGLSEAVRESFHVTTLNETHVVATGLRNRREWEVEDTFRWIAEHSHSGYGLLYLRSEYPDADGQTHFRVQRMSLGRIEELEDRYLEGLA